MATVIRPEISEKNKHWIPKHRYYELKHFCLQYPIWKKAYMDTTELYKSSLTFEQQSSSNIPSDITAQYAIRKAKYAEKLELIEKAAMEADVYLYDYILKAVTEGLSYTYLKSTLEIPCGKDMYYDRYRKFFKILSEARD